MPHNYDMYVRSKLSLQAVILSFFNQKEKKTLNILLP